MTKRVKDFRPASRNANKHTARGMGELQKSIQSDGWIGAMTTAADGEMIAGSARIETVAQVFGTDAEPIVVESDGTRPVLVVRTDIPNADDKRAQRLALADNRVHEIDMSWDVEVLAGFDADVIGELWTPDELSDLGDKWADDKENLLGVAKDAKPRRRALPLDLIFTMNSHGGAFCCIATYSGWLYGVNSNIKNVCARTGQGLSHDIRFVDNDYFHYDHQKHLGIVQEYKPKYCTVRDIMAREQCKEAGIDYYPFEQIMDWAEELSQYAQNVIVIPKYDCFDKIPEKFMLGYSVPTSHGGTPLPVEAFKGRRVHLLGGSWKAQLAHMAQLGDDVVSVDNNYVMKEAGFATYVNGDGSSGNLTDDLHLGVLTNPMYVAFTISVGNIAAKVNELYAGSANPAE